MRRVIALLLVTTALVTTPACCFVASSIEDPNIYGGTSIIVKHGVESDYTPWWQRLIVILDLPATFVLDTITVPLLASYTLARLEEWNSYRPNQ